MDNGNFSLIKRREVPKGKIILPAVWQMKHKHNIKTSLIKKCKARLNIDGSIPAVTCPPPVMWSILRRPWIV